MVHANSLLLYACSSFKFIAGKPRAPRHQHPPAVLSFYDIDYQVKQNKPEKAVMFTCMHLNVKVYTIVAWFMEPLIGNRNLNYMS